LTAALPAGCADQPGAEGVEGSQSLTLEVQEPRPGEPPRAPAILADEIESPNLAQFARLAKSGLPHRDLQIVLVMF
jgi:hypothetical protein